ncbi:kelch 40a [Paramuricea clavata]|uniref:Kelch 40a n=1 Tax=Paramuricea clavata TaxID=317549 RepID=A0A6S7IFM6_PARCT|nr:kelch 40a [Paramuricea clavata]
MALPHSDLDSDISPLVSDDEDEDNIFSRSWNDSDVVLVLGKEKFHVHRCILSLQSPVFKAMLNGNFKDAKQDEVELKGDKYEAMVQFLKLLYPKNMLNEDNGRVKINDENVFEILEVADKYAAINVIKQCMRKPERLKPENAMGILPYAARHELPVEILENIFDIIARRISIKELENFAPQLSNDTVYKQCLVGKCRYLEKRFPRNWKS